MPRGSRKQQQHDPRLAQSGSHGNGPVEGLNQNLPNTGPGNHGYNGNGVGNAQQNVGYDQLQHQAFYMAQHPQTSGNPPPGLQRGPGEMRHGPMGLMQDANYPNVPPADYAAFLNMNGMTQNMHWQQQQQLAMGQMGHMGQMGQLGQVEQRRQMGQMGPGGPMGHLGRMGEMGQMQMHQHMMQRANMQYPPHQPPNWPMGMQNQMAIHRGPPGLPPPQHQEQRPQMPPGQLQHYPGQLQHHQAHQQAYQANMLHGQPNQNQGHLQQQARQAQLHAAQQHQLHQQHRQAVPPQAPHMQLPHMQRPHMQPPNHLRPEQMEAWQAQMQRHQQHAQQHQAQQQLPPNPIAMQDPGFGYQQPNERMIHEQRMRQMMQQQAANQNANHAEFGRVPEPFRMDNMAQDWPIQQQMNPMNPEHGMRIIPEAVQQNNNARQEVNLEPQRPPFQDPSIQAMRAPLPVPDNIGNFQGMPIGQNPQLEIQQNIFNENGSNNRMNNDATLWDNSFPPIDMGPSTSNGSGNQMFFDQNLEFPQEQTGPSTSSPPNNQTFFNPEQGPVEPTNSFNAQNSRENGNGSANSAGISPNNNLEVPREFGNRAGSSTDSFPMASSIPSQNYPETNGNPAPWDNQLPVNSEWEQPTSSGSNNQSFYNTEQSVLPQETNSFDAQQGQNESTDQLEIHTQPIDMIPSVEPMRSSTINADNVVPTTLSNELTIEISSSSIESHVLPSGEGPSTSSSSGNQILPSVQNESDNTEDFQYDDNDDNTDLFAYLEQNEAEQPIVPGQSGQQYCSKGVLRDEDVAVGLLNFDNFHKQSSQPVLENDPSDEQSTSTDSGETVQETSREQQTAEENMQTTEQYVSEEYEEFNYDQDVLEDEDVSMTPVQNDSFESECSSQTNATQDILREAFNKAFITDDDDTLNVKPSNVSNEATLPFSEHVVEYKNADQTNIGDRSDSLETFEQLEPIDEDYNIWKSEERMKESTSSSISISEVATPENVPVYNLYKQLDDVYDDVSPDEESSPENVKIPEVVDSEIEENKQQETTTEETNPQNEEQPQNSSFVQEESDEIEQIFSPENTEDNQNVINHNDFEDAEKNEDKSDNDEASNSPLLRYKKYYEERQMRQDNPFGGWRDEVYYAPDGNITYRPRYISESSSNMSDGLVPSDAQSDESVNSKKTDETSGDKDVVNHDDTEDPEKTDDKNVDFTPENDQTNPSDEWKHPEEEEDKTDAEEEEEPSDAQEKNLNRPIRIFAPNNDVFDAMIPNDAQIYKSGTSTKADEEVIDLTESDEELEKEIEESDVEMEKDDDDDSVELLEDEEVSDEKEETSTNASIEEIEFKDNSVSVEEGDNLLNTVENDEQQVLDSENIEEPVSSGELAELQESPVLNVEEIQDLSDNDDFEVVDGNIQEEITVAEDEYPNTEHVEDSFNCEMTEKVPEDESVENPIDEIESPLLDDVQSSSNDELENDSQNDEETIQVVQETLNDILDEIDDIEFLESKETPEELFDDFATPLEMPFSLNTSFLLSKHQKAVKSKENLQIVDDTPKEEVPIIIAEIIEEQNQHLEFNKKMEHFDCDIEVEKNIDQHEHVDEDVEEIPQNSVLTEDSNEQMEEPDSKGNQIENISVVDAPFTEHIDSTPSSPVTPEIVKEAVEEVEKTETVSQENDEGTQHASDFVSIPNLVLMDQSEGESEATDEPHEQNSDCDLEEEEVVVVQEGDETALFDEEEPVLEEEMSIPADEVTNAEEMEQHAEPLDDSAAEEEQIDVDHDSMEQLGEPIPSFENVDETFEDNNHEEVSDEQVDVREDNVAEEIDEAEEFEPIIVIPQEEDVEQVTETSEVSGQPESEEHTEQTEDLDEEIDVVSQELPPQSPLVLQSSVESTLADSSFEDSNVVNTEAFEHVTETSEVSGQTESEEHTEQTEAMGKDLSVTSQTNVVFEESPQSPFVVQSSVETTPDDSSIADSNVADAEETLPFEHADEFADETNEQPILEDVIEQIADDESIEKEALKIAKTWDRVDKKREAKKQQLAEQLENKAIEEVLNIDDESDVIVQEQKEEETFQSDSISDDAQPTTPSDAVAVEENNEVVHEVLEKVLETVESSEVVAEISDVDVEETNEQVDDVSQETENIDEQLEEQTVVADSENKDEISDSHEHELLDDDDSTSSPQIVVDEEENIPSSDFPSADDNSPEESELTDSLNLIIKETEQEVVEESEPTIDIVNEATEIAKQWEEEEKKPILRKRRGRAAKGDVIVGEKKARISSKKSLSVQAETALKNLNAVPNGQVVAADPSVVVERKMPVLPVVEEVVTTEEEHFCEEEEEVNAQEDSDEEVLYYAATKKQPKEQVLFAWEKSYRPSDKEIAEEKQIKGRSSPDTEELFERRKHVDSKETSPSLIDTTSTCSPATSEPGGEHVGDCDNWKGIPKRNNPAVNSNNLWSNQRPMYRTPFPVSTNPTTAMSMTERDYWPSLRQRVPPTSSAYPRQPPPRSLKEAFPQRRAFHYPPVNQEPPRSLAMNRFASSYQSEYERLRNRRNYFQQNRNYTMSQPARTATSEQVVPPPFIPTHAQFPPSSMPSVSSQRQYVIKQAAAARRAVNKAQAAVVVVSPPANHQIPKETLASKVSAASTNMANSRQDAMKASNSKKEKAAEEKQKEQSEDPPTPEKIQPKKRFPRKRNTKTKTEDQEKLYRLDLGRLLEHDKTDFIETAKKNSCLESLDIVIEVMHQRVTSYRYENTMECDSREMELLGFTTRDLFTDVPSLMKIMSPGSSTLASYMFINFNDRPKAYTTSMRNNVHRVVTTTQKKDDKRTPKFPIPCFMMTSDDFYSNWFEVPEESDCPMEECMFLKYAPLSGLDFEETMEDDLKLPFCSVFETETQEWIRANNRRTLRQHELSSLVRVLHPVCAPSDFRGCQKPWTFTTLQNIYYYVALLSFTRATQGFVTREAALIVAEMTYHLASTGAFGTTDRMAERMQMMRDVILRQGIYSEVSKNHSEWERLSTVCGNAVQFMRRALFDLDRDISLPCFKWFFIYVTEPNRVPFSRDKNPAVLRKLIKAYTLRKQQFSDEELQRTRRATEGMNGKLESHPKYFDEYDPSYVPNVEFEPIVWPEYDEKNLDISFYPAWFHESKELFFNTNKKRLSYFIKKGWLKAWEIIIPQVGEEIADEYNRVFDIYRILEEEKRKEKEIIQRRRASRSSAQKRNREQMCEDDGEAFDFDEDDEEDELEFDPVPLKRRKNNKGSSAPSEEATAIPVKPKRGRKPAKRVEVATVTPATNSSDVPAPPAPEAPVKRKRGRQPGKRKGPVAKKQAQPVVSSGPLIPEPQDPAQGTPAPPAKRRGRPPRSSTDPKVPRTRRDVPKREDNPTLRRNPRKKVLEDFVSIEEVFSTRRSTKAQVSPPPPVSVSAPSDDFEEEF